MTQEETDEDRAFRIARGSDIPIPQVTMSEPWTLAHFYKMPGNLNGEEIIEVRLDDGSTPPPRPARNWHWKDCDIVAYRVLPPPPTDKG